MAMLTAEGFGEVGIVALGDFLMAARSQGNDLEVRLGRGGGCRKEIPFALASARRARSS